MVGIDACGVLVAAGSKSGLGDETGTIVAKSGVGSEPIATGVSPGGFSAVGVITPTEI